MATRREVLAAVVLALVAFALANDLARRHPLRADWTHAGRYSLSERTRAILSTLAEPVTLTSVIAAPLSAESPDEYVAARLAEDVRELLRSFGEASRFVRVRTVDPLRDPARARDLLTRFQVRLPQVVLVERGAARRAVGVPDMADLGPPSAPGGPPEIRAFRGEQALAEAILAVGEDRRPLALFSRGHGERDPEDHGSDGVAALDRALRRAGFATAPLDFERALPAEALVVVAGPDRPFPLAQAAALATHLSRGGSLLALLDPGERRTGLEALLARHGFRLGPLVRDPHRAFPFAPDDTFVVRDLGEHPVTAPLAGRDLVVARAREVRGPSPLLRASARARRAPLAAASEGPARLVVAGDSDLAANAHLESLANEDFLVRAALWLVRSEPRLDLPPRRLDRPRLSLARGDLRLALVLAVVLLPGSAATVGLWLFARRRRRR